MTPPLSQIIENRTSQSMENRREGSHFGRSRPKCSYCHRLGHTRDVICILQGRPPNNAHIIQNGTAGNKGFSYLKGNIMSSFSIVQVSKHSVAQPDTSIVEIHVSQSSTLGPWIVF